MNTKPIEDDFRGDNAHLRESIKALIELSDSGVLVPHGIGGHARALLAATYHRLPLKERDDALKIERLKIGLVALACVLAVALMLVCQLLTR